MSSACHLDNSFAISNAVMSMLEIDTEVALTGMLQEDLSDGPYQHVLEGRGYRLGGQFVNYGNA